MSTGEEIEVFVYWYDPEAGDIGVPMPDFCDALGGTLGGDGCWSVPTVTARR